MRRPMNERRTEGLDWTLVVLIVLLLVVVALLTQGVWMPRGIPHR